MTGHRGAPHESAHTAPPAVLVLGAGEEYMAIVDDVTRILAGVCPVVPVADVSGALEWLRGSHRDGDAGEEAHPGRRVTLVVQLAGREKPSDVLQAICAVPGSEAARLLLITDASSHADLAWVIDNDRLDAVLTLPWRTRTLERILRAHASRHRRAGASAGRAHGEDSVEQDHHENEGGKHDGGVVPAAVESQLLANLTLSTKEATSALLDSIEQVLGPRPRLHLPPDVRIIHENDEVNAVLLVLSGRVAMSMHSRVGEVLLHHASTGPVVGLLSLADQERAFVTARTTTSAEVVHLTVEQLDRSLRENPDVGSALTAVSIRVLSARLRRAQNLHVEKYELAVELEKERSRLAEALDALERARTQMIAQARFATLGELSAGIAHELNNPIAAVARGVDHLAHDVGRLLATHPHGEFVAEVIARVQQAGHASTKDERRWRREVGEVVGDRELARRLVAIGIRDAETARRFVTEDPGRRGRPPGGTPLRDGLRRRGGGPRRRAGADMPTEERLELAEIAAGIGASLRNLDLAGHHVQNLVGSLRVHARPDAAEPVAVDVVDSLTNATLLVGHRLRDVEVEWSLEQGLPPVAGQPGALGQVWANILVNAVDATAEVDQPRILINVRRGEATGPTGTDATDATGAAGTVVVSVTDNGVGVSEENLERIFQPRFTTKKGSVRYGLGMGLGISRRLLEDHGATLDVTSRPGETTFVAILPTFTGECPEHPGPPPPQIPTPAGQRPAEQTPAGQRSADQRPADQRSANQRPTKGTTP